MGNLSACLLTIQWLIAISGCTLVVPHLMFLVYKNVSSRVVVHQIMDPENHAPVLAASSNSSPLVVVDRA